MIRSRQEHESGIERKYAELEQEQVWNGQGQDKNGIIIQKKEHNFLIQSSCYHVMSYSVMALHGIQEHDVRAWEDSRSMANDASRYSSTVRLTSYCHSHANLRQATTDHGNSANYGLGSGTGTVLADTDSILADTS